MLPGGYNTRFGEPESGDLNPGRADGQAGQELRADPQQAPDRLGITGTPSDAAVFSYTGGLTGQAVGQMALGSIYKKGLTTANMVDDKMRRKDKEAVKGGVKASARPQPRRQARRSRPRTSSG